jgi:hypothetical protein
MSKKLKLVLTDIFTRTHTRDVEPVCPHCQHKLEGEKALKEIAFRPEAMLVDLDEDGEGEEWTMGERLDW